MPMMCRCACIYCKCMYTHICVTHSHTGCINDVVPYMYSFQNYNFKHSVRAKYSVKL